MALAAVVERPLPAFSVACAAPAGRLPARADAPGQGSCDARRDREKRGCADSRSAGTASTVPSFAQQRRRSSPPCGCGSSTPIVPLRTACRPVAPRAHALGHTQLDADEPARSPVFCCDFLHDLDLEITLGDQLLQPRILCLKLPQPTHVVRLQAPEPLAPGVDRLLANPVPLGDRRHRLAIRLPDDRDHLLFRETCFAHCSLRIGSQSLTYPTARNPGGRSRGLTWLPELTLIRPTDDRH